MHKLFQKLNSFNLPTLRDIATNLPIEHELDPELSNKQKKNVLSDRIEEWGLKNTHWSNTLVGKAIISLLVGLVFFIPTKCSNIQITKELSAARVQIGVLDSTLNILKNPIASDFQLIEFKFNFQHSRFPEFLKTMDSNEHLKNQQKFMDDYQIESTAQRVPKEIIPREIENLVDHFKWIRMHIVDTITTDIHSSHQYMHMTFRKEDTNNWHVNKLISPNGEIEGIQLVISSKEIYATEINKFESLTHTAQLCNKQVVIESNFRNYNSSKTPYGLNIGELYIRDSNLNDFEIKPVNFHWMSILPQDLKHINFEKTIVTVGEVICKN